MRCGGLILSYCPRNPHGKAGNEETRRKMRKSPWCSHQSTHKKLTAGWLKGILLIYVEPSLPYTSPLCEFWEGHTFWVFANRKVEYAHEPILPACFLSSMLEDDVECCPLFLLCCRFHLRDQFFGISANLILVN